MSPNETLPVKRSRIVALSRALGSPAKVVASDGDTVEDALVEMATKSLRAQAVDGRNSALVVFTTHAIAWSMTHNGDHVGNVFTDKDHAHVRMRTLNKNYPEDKRELVPLVPAACENVRALFYMACGVQRQIHLLKELGKRHTSELDPYGGLMYFDDAELMEQLLAWIVAIHPQANPDGAP
jgi:hypothetical protein